MKVYLVRHGESEGNKEMVFQRPDTPLTKKGEAQAEEVAKRLSGQDINIVFASPYTRAAKTAEAIAQKMKLKVEYWEDLHEIKRPDFLLGKSIHGKDGKEFEKHLVESYQKQDAKHPGEETFTELKARAQKILNHLVENHKNQNVLLVSHATTIKTIAFEAIFDENLVPELFWKIRRHVVTKNTGVTILEYTSDRGWILLTWGDVSHL